MGQARRIEDEIQQLEEQVWAVVRSHAPHSKETQEHLRLVASWTESSPAVVRKAQALANKGEVRAAQQLIDDHNAARPRRRPGRPHKVMPRPAQLAKALRDQLVSLALEQLREDASKIPQLVNSTAAVLLPTKQSDK